MAALWLGGGRGAPGDGHARFVWHWQPPGQWASQTSNASSTASVGESRPPASTSSSNRSPSSRRTRATSVRRSSARLGGGQLGPIDLESQRTFYFLCLGLLVISLGLMVRLRRSGIGRGFIGVRDNEDAAASFTVSPMRSKLAAFALSGGLAGAVLGALWVIGLPVLLGDTRELELFTSGAGLLLVLMYLPGGLIQLVHWGRDALLRLAARQHPAAAEGVIDGNEVPRSLRPAGLVERPEVESIDGVAALRAEAVSVRFGGRVAVDRVDLTVAAGDLVGLIGANGSGKTTLMNAIGGFVRSTGRVELWGGGVTGISPARRARAGLGRTFQQADLFADVTVRETVSLALEACERTTLTSTLLVLPKGTRAERRKAAQASELIGFLGLGRYADTAIRELSTGTRRIVDLACLLALDARLLCMDEPTAGVAQKEAEPAGPQVVDEELPDRGDVLLEECSLRGWVRHIT